MTATATKSAPKRTAADESLARTLDDAKSGYAVEQQIVAEIEERHREVELTPGNLQLFPSESHYFARHLDAGNPFAVIRILARQREIRELRERCGSPQQLADARSALAAAVEALDGSEGEAIRQQIQELESKLTALNRTKVAAEREVARLEKMRLALRSLAPEALRQQVESDLREFQSRSPVWGRLAEVQGNIRALEQQAATVASLRSEIEWIENQHDHIRARHTKRHDDLTSEVGVLESKLASGGLPALRAEQQRLESEWQALVAQAESPLDRWASTGEL